MTSMGIEGIVGLTSRARTAFAWHCDPALRRVLVLLLLLLTLPLPVLAAGQGLAASPVDSGELWPALEVVERGGSASAAANVQRLATLLARTEPDSLERLELLSLQGSNFLELRQQEPLTRVQQALRDWPLAQPHGRAARVALALLNAQQMVRGGKADQAQAALALLSEPATGEAPPSLLFRAHVQLAILQADAGRLDASVASAQAALRIADRAGSSWRRAQALGAKAYVYLRAQQADRAEAAVVEALREAERDPDPMLMYRTHNTRGIVYAALGQPAPAEQSMQKAVEAARSSGSLTLLSLALGNLADFQLRQGSFLRARELAEEGLALALKAEDLGNESLTRHNLGLALIATRQLEPGRQQVLRSIAISEDQGLSGQVADSWHELAQYLERFGDAAGALQAYQRYRRLIDLQLRDETRNALLELQAGYDDERRANEMQLLNQDNRLKAEQLRARDLQLQLWALLAVCVVLSALLLGLAYRRTRRSNSALALSNAMLKQQSERDPLTGLANRRFLQAAMRRMAERGPLRAAVFLIDVDHFKRINDSFGHAAGDAVLVEVARRLRACLREDDLLVRWGGEEFLIVLEGGEPAATSESADAALAQRLLDALAGAGLRYGSGAGQLLQLSASIGFARFPLPPQRLAVGWERAIAWVDSLMYLAKAHGRNRACGLLALGRDAATAAAEATDETVETVEALQRLVDQLEGARQAGLAQLCLLQGPPLAAAEQGGPSLDPEA